VEAYYPNAHTELLKLIFSSSETTSLAVTERRLKDWDDEDFDHVTNVTLVVVAVVVALMLIIWLTYAKQYKHSITDKRSPFTGGGPAELAMLKPGKICDCCFDLHLCLHSCFCFDLRAGDTFQTAALAGYWFVVVAFIIEWIMAEAIGMIFQAYVFKTTENSGEAIGWIIASFLLSFYLSDRRAKYVSKFGGISSYPMDILCYWWCQPCMVAQDANALDKAQGVHVECCCKLVQTGQPAQGVIVGEVTGVKAQA
jgi:Cys-rich protein (TIGR01571 family)